MKKLTESDVHTPHWGIDEMPNLKHQLGKANCDKIRSIDLARNEVGSKRTRWVDNPHMEYMQRFKPYEGGPVEDIICGSAALDINGSDSVSASRLHNLLACYTSISTDLIKLGLGIDDRQARRYLAAARVAIKNLTRHRNGNHASTNNAGSADT